MSLSSNENNSNERTIDSVPSVDGSDDSLWFLKCVPLEENGSNNERSSTPPSLNFAPSPIIVSDSSRSTSSSFADSVCSTTASTTATTKSSCVVVEISADTVMHSVALAEAEGDDNMDEEELDDVCSLASEPCFPSRDNLRRASAGPMHMMGAWDSLCDEVLKEK